MKIQQNLTPPWLLFRVFYLALNKFLSNNYNTNNNVAYLFIEAGKHEDKSYFSLSKLTSFQLLFIIKALKPDHFNEAVSLFVASSIGREFITPSVFDLQDLYVESNCRVPVMFMLAPGKNNFIIYTHIRTI